MAVSRFWQKPVDFFARFPHYVDHMLPVWQALKGVMRGRFYLPEYLQPYAETLMIEDVEFLRPRSESPTNVAPSGHAPLLVSAYGDMATAWRSSPQRPFLRMDHGIGFTFDGHNGYVAGRGMMSRVKLYLAQSDYVRAKVARAHPKLPQVVIGTPKLDGVRRHVSTFRGRKPVVCISFHWDGKRVAPEAGNAFSHYRDVLPVLAAQDDFQLIGHGHPKYREVLAAEYEAAGIEMLWDFCDVMRVADVYVNDCSSTMYEFCTTGKPVVVMNAPWFRREKAGDIRFWDYADVGPQVETADELLPTIRAVLENDRWMVQRQKMLDDLYPHRGYAAQRAAAAIEAFVGAMR
jgi:hypothetical protein